MEKVKELLGVLVLCTFLSGCAEGIALASLGISTTDLYLTVKEQELSQAIIEECREWKAIDLSESEYDNTPESVTLRILINDANYACLCEDKREMCLNGSTR